MRHDAQPSERRPLPPRQLVIKRSGHAEAALVIPAPDIVHSDSDHAEFGAGSVWVSALGLAVDAPRGGYCGLQVRRGVAQLSERPTVAGGVITVSEACVIVLTLDLDPPSEPPVGEQVGADAAMTRADLPDQVEFRLDSAVGRLRDPGDITVTAYGCALTLHWLDAPSTYDESTGCVLLPFGTDGVVFAVRESRSSLFRPSGEALVRTAAWAVPVSTAPTSKLGSASGAGAIALFLDAGLRGDWRGLAGPPDAAGRTALRFDTVTLLAGTGRLRMSVPAALGTGHEQRTSLWAGPSEARLVFTAPGPLSYVARAGTDETLTVTATSMLSLDRPRPVSGEPLTMSGPGTATLSADHAGRRLHLQVRQHWPGEEPSTAYGLANAILTVSPPRSAQLTCSLDDNGAAPSGELALQLAMQGLTWTLPDPYVSSQPQAAIVGGAGASLIAKVMWSDPQHPLVGFTVPEPPRAADALAGAPAGAAVEDDDARARAALREIFESAAGRVHEEIRLLDVSTNVDQLGVGIGVPQDAGAQPVFTVEGMDVVTDASNVRLLLLPQFQWEPVVNVPDPDVGEFPSPLVSGSDGGPTVIGSQPTGSNPDSVRLVPVRPDAVGDRLAGELTAGTASVGWLGTLPFGMLVAARLGTQAGDGASVKMDRPAAGELRGARQFTITAGTGGSLPGAIWQSRNAVDPNTLEPTGFSVLRGGTMSDGVEKYVNDQLGPRSGSPLAPVSRVDLAGIGATMFSRWASDVPPPSVGQVRFDVWAGRTAHEVIQANSVLYPWGVPIARTVTMARRAEGHVLRADTGWVAGGPGYQFPPPAPNHMEREMIIHRGLVGRVDNIRHIRETGRTVSVASHEGKAELLEVSFDADFTIQGASVPGLNHVGFVQRETKQGALTPEQLAALITAEGPIGGPAPCTVDLADSGQLMNVIRIDVATARRPGASAPEFAVAAHGALQFRGHGEWTMLRRRYGIAEPEPVDASTGVPVVRRRGENLLRISEQADLLHVQTPELEYAVVHSSDGHQVQFRRPCLQAGGEPGRGSLVGTEPLLLADTYARSLAPGTFALADDCFPGPGPWSLSIDNDGYTLASGDAVEFTNNLPDHRRTLVDAPTVGLHAQYDGPIRYTLESGRWTVEIRDVTAWIGIGPWNTTIVGLRSTYSAADDHPVELRDPTARFSGVLGDVADVLWFLTPLLGIGASYEFTTVPGSTKWATKYAIKVPEQDFGQVKLDTTVGEVWGGWQPGEGWAARADIAGGLRVAIRGPFFGTGTFKVKFAGSQHGARTGTIRLMWGAAIESGGPGDTVTLSAATNNGVQVSLPTNSTKDVAVVAEIVGRASIRLLADVAGSRFASVGVRFEITTSPTREGDTWYVAGTVTVAAEITVCWFLTISVEAPHNYHERLL